MKRLVKSLIIGTAFTLSLVTHAIAQTKVVIGHFGDPLPYKALIVGGCEPAHKSGCESAF